MSSKDKYISFSTRGQEQFITSDNSILKVKAELELIKDEKGNFIVKKVTTQTETMDITFKLEGDKQVENTETHELLEPEKYGPEEL